MAAHCIPSNPDISGIGVRAAIYAQNLLCFAPVVAYLWDGEISADELKGIQDQSIGMLSVAFAILISTIVEARAKGGLRITSFHAAVVLDLSWMNNTSMLIWFLLYAHHRTKAVGDRLAIPATWKGWKKAFMSPLRYLAGVKDMTDSETLDANNGIFKRLRHLLLQSPVLTIGSMHLSLMAGIGIWLWSDPLIFGRPIPCDPSLSNVSLSIVGRAVRFSSPVLRICSLFIYSLVLIPGINLIAPFSIFIAFHILHNNSRKRHPAFWSTVAHPLRSIRSTILRGRTSDVESQNNNSLSDAGTLASLLDTQTGFLLIGLGCLAAINVIFVIDVELALVRNKNPDSQDDEWGFGQVLALLLLVVPVRDFLSSIIEIRRKLYEHDRYAEERQHRFEDALHTAIDTNHIDIAKFRALIENGADPDTPVQGRKVVTLFQLAAYLGEVDVMKSLIDRVNINIDGGEYGRPIDAFIANGNTKVVELLLSKATIKIDLPPELGPAFDRMTAKNQPVEAARLIFLQASKTIDMRATIVGMTRMLQRASDYDRRVGLEGLSRFAEIVEWREALRPAIQDLIAALNDANSDVRRAAIQSLTCFARIGEWFHHIRPATSDIIAALTETRGTVADAAQQSLSYLAGIEWRAEIQKSIPRLTKALKSSDVETTLIQLSRLAKIPQLRGEVRAVLPSLIALLKDPNRRVRGCALEALSSLAVIEEWHNDLRPVVSAMIAALTSTSSNSRKLALHGLSEVAQFVEWHEEVRTAIPLMIAAVQDSDVTLEASHSLLCLAKLEEFREDRRPVILAMIAALKHSNRFLTRLLSNLSELVEIVDWFDEILSAIPCIIEGLKHSSWSKFPARQGGIQVLLTIAKKSKPCEETRSAISTIIKSLADSQWQVRATALSTLSELGKTAQWREEIWEAMPRMIAALEDPRPHVRKVALESLLYLSDLAEWREGIRAAIPRMIEAPRKSSKDGLLLLAQIPEYREDVRPALPSIVSSVKGTTWRDRLSVLEGLSRLPAEWYEDLRPAIVEGIAEMDAPVPELDPSAGKDVLQTLSNVVEIAEWREAIRPAIPAMIAAFQRYQHMDALQRLAKMTAWHEEIRLAISEMIIELEEPQLNFRDAALKALSVLAEIAELRKEILPAIPGIIAVLNTNTDPLLPNSRGPEAALICLSNLAEIADWREIRPAVPVMIAALKDSTLVVPALECLSRLGNIAELRAEILTAIPAMISFLTDSRPTVREAALKGITCLATMANPAARLNVLGADSDVEDCVIQCFARALVAFRRRPQLTK